VKDEKKTAPAGISLQGLNGLVFVDWKISFQSTEQ